MNFCSDAREILQFVGTILFIFKILIPVLLIIWGSLDLGKAVVAQNEDEIKKATGILVKRVVFAIIIFFIPNIISLVFNLVGSFKNDADIQAEYRVCSSCIVSPFKDC